MVVEYVRYRITGDATAFEAAYALAQSSLRRSAQCLSWELLRCHEAPDRFILRIAWDSLDGHLRGFRGSPEFRAFFEAIQGYVDQIEEMQHYLPTSVHSQSIYQAVGGVETFFRLARLLHEKLSQDALLGEKFSKAAPSHVPHLAMWLTEVFGGPRLYSSTLDDISGMLQRHAGQSISEVARARFVVLAKEAARACVPEGAEAAVLAIGRYFEWGSQIAVQNSQPAHRPDPAAGVPSWDWQS